MTIKSKTQLEKTNQELLVEKEALLLELEEIRGQNAELRLELARAQSNFEGKSRVPAHLEDEKKSRRTSKNFEATTKTGESPTKAPPAGAASQKHSFSVSTFPTPTKSHVSGRLLFGSVRQGLRCDSECLSLFSFFSFFLFVFFSFFSLLRNSTMLSFPHQPSLRVCLRARGEKSSLRHLWHLTNSPVDRVHQQRMWVPQDAQVQGHSPRMEADLGR